MDLSADRVKRIDDRHKYLIYGFMRTIESTISAIYENDPYYTTPELVIFTCLLFYYMHETFDKIASEHIQSGIDNNTITKKGKNACWENTSYGIDWIDSMSNDIYVFSITIHCLKFSYNVGVGFVTNNHHQDTEHDFETLDAIWYRNDAMVLIVNKQDVPLGEDFEKLECGVNDTLHLILNMRKGELECYKNDKQSEEEVLYDKITKSSGVKWRFALTLYYDQDSVTVTRKLVNLT